MQISSASIRPTTKASAEYFHGPVFLDTLVSAAGPSRLNATMVTFTPGARTAWHNHGFRQILFVTGGKGIVQVKGEPARQLLPGDVAIIPPDVIHWHGAASDSIFSHLALLESEGEGTQWAEQVSEEDYVTVTEPQISD